MLIAGIDIGNSTTEVCISTINNDGKLIFLSANESETTGIKGTKANIKGIKSALYGAFKNIDAGLNDLTMIRLNEAAPVIGDTAMETISETIISESTMVGHNPSTPAGEGLAVGKTVSIDELSRQEIGQPILVVVTQQFDYEKVAIILNTTKANIVGVILQKDEAVLVYNRLNNKVPIIDEVTKIDALPLNHLAAIEVAAKGNSIKALSNPYGIAKVFDLSPDETRSIIPIAKSLIGKKSAVVIHTPNGGVKEKSLDAGTITMYGVNGVKSSVNVDEGSKKIMEALSKVEELSDIHADENTIISNMFNRMKESMVDVNEKANENLKIQDLLAIDTFIPVTVKGALAGEVAMEKAVAVAAMVKTEKLPMEQLAKLLKEDLNIPVYIAGVEAVMATLGALTTVGTKLPLAILDLGGGSTDAAILEESGRVSSIHLAGAGSFATMLINEGLALNNLVVAEWIKRYPLAKVESLYQMTLENGEVIFSQEPFDPKLYGRVVLVKENEYVPLITNHSLEQILRVRKAVKRKVFVTNALRALEKIAPDGQIRNVPNVAMVGGSALDREIPEMITAALAEYNIVAGSADVQGRYGPRNAVATGLCMSYTETVGN